MSTPGPVLPPPPDPDPDHPEPGILARFEEFIHHFRPELADLRIKLANAETDRDKALAWVAAHKASVERLAALGVKLAAAVSPADGAEAQGLVAEAEAIAAEVAKLAGEFGAGM